MYVHPEKDMIIVAHVDDFLCLGSKAELVLFLQGLQGEFECTGQMLGYGAEEVREFKFLGRTVRLADGGLEWEGDAEHVEAFLEKLGSESLKDSRTPGTKRDVGSEVRAPLGPAEAKDYRGLVALFNFISQDRPDISYASKEVSKCMSSPAVCDMGPLKRMARYLSLYPRSVCLYNWQEAPASIEVFTDSDWGGDLATRRSTSGGCILRGSHLVAHWSRTQQVVALSSAEAELNGICKAASEGLAASNMAMELLHLLPLEVRTDASAARGIVQRQGTGKVKHLEVRQFWVQEREANHQLQVIKIPRAINWSDLMTHHWSESEGDMLLAGMSVLRRGHPHESPARGGQRDQTLGEAYGE